jgi:hypothetical protein
MVTGGIRITKAITKCVLSNSICKTQHMSSTNNNDYHYNEREKQVLEVYDQGKSTHDIFVFLHRTLMWPCMYLHLHYY